MAKLIHCHICKHEMSSTAELCPNCNHNHEKDRKEKNDFIQIIAFLGAAAILFGLYKLGIFDPLIQGIFPFKKP